MEANLLSTIFHSILDAFANHGIDWLITIFVTFISVRLATKKYYYSIREINVKPILELGLKKILNEEIIPPNAQAILVENKGIFILKRKKYKCSHMFEKKRKTVSVVGGDSNRASSKRPRYYGVLGLAYDLNRPVIYDFQRHKLYVYDFKLVEYKVEFSGNEFYYVNKNKPHVLSNNNTTRSLMFAIPLVLDDKIVGGITFDVNLDSNLTKKLRSKEISYIPIEDTDTEEDINNKLERNFILYSELLDLRDNILNAFFIKRK